MALILDLPTQSKLTSTLHQNYAMHHLHPFSHAFFQKKTTWHAHSSQIQEKHKRDKSITSKKEIADWQTISIPTNLRQNVRTSIVYLTFARIRMELNSFFNAYFRFLTLSQHDFVASTVIDNSQFIEQFIKNYGKDADKKIHLPSSRTLPFQVAPISPNTQLIFDSVRYAPTYAQQLYMSPDTSSPRIMFQWLEKITKKRVFQLPNRSMNRDVCQQNLLWFNRQSFHPLSEWLASQFQKSILMYYFNRDDRHVPVQQLKKYIRQKGVDHSITNLLKIPLRQRQQGATDLLEGSIAILRSFQDKMKEDFEKKSINITEYFNKRRRRKRKKPRKMSTQQKSSEIKQIAQGLQQLNNFKSSKQLNQPTLLQAYHIEQLEQEICLMDNIPATAQNDQQKAIQQDINPQALPPIKSTSKKSQRTCCGQLSQEQSEKHIEIQDDFPRRKLSIVEELMCQANDEKRKKRKRKPTKNTKIFDQLKDKATHRLLNKQLDSFLGALSAQSNSSYESKVIAFERVRYFVKSIFPHAQVLLFGSNAVGLSLPSSDIDIMLIGLQYTSRDELCDYLAQIGVYINSMGWVVSCSTYLGAKVPLLKLEIDTSIKYCTPKIKLDYHQAQDPYLSYYLDLRDSATASIVKIDITISLDQSQISQSTELMRNWLHQKPSIQRILLALKYTLSVRGYNQNFKGGIGSYCLFVMVSAYFQHFNEKRQLSDCQILLDILKFYGEQFENHLKIIHLTNSQYCYYTNQQAIQQFQLTQQLIFSNSLKILDPLNKKLMSSSCHQYCMIKTEWRRIRKKILSIRQQIQQQVSASFTNIADMTKILSNPKFFEKCVNRLQGRIQTSIGDILKGSQ